MQYSNITDKWWTAADHLVTTASRHNSLICLLTFPVAEFLESVPGHGKPCKQAWCSRFRLMSSVPHRQILLCCTTTTCPATPQVTWPTIVSSSPTPVSDNSVLPTLKHLLSVGHTAVLETGPLPPQDHKSGTVCHPISDYVGCHMASSGGYWRHFYSDSEATTQCELFLTVPNRNILTYLLHLLILWDIAQQNL